ncbi:unnamed protein product [Porites lobata]|uniref:Uncharacterized protein n=1 Tax=Porites lobata TaxID=104759 RepID=A0ABN8Q4E9_9CNID|nr:unnamed protein product [Porites lobata]
MEPRSRETTPKKEELDFIVDDGYRHDVDPDYVPDEKYVVTGKEFKKLTRNAKKLGAESLDYSTRKNNKYMATLPGGKKVHFGSPKYPDYTIHKDKERRNKYLSRAKKIKNKQGELTYNNPESPNYCPPPNILDTRLIAIGIPIDARVPRNPPSICLRVGLITNRPPD